MSTGSFESLTGNIADIGVLYPFEGSELFWVIATSILWVIWILQQVFSEQIRLKQESKYLTAERLTSMISKR